MESSFNMHMHTSHAGVRKVENMASTSLFAEFRNRRPRNCDARRKTLQSHRGERPKA
ncbi:hypothetical protein HMPREF0762_00098 [Slackia exigua ATCC 700122]|uniref:Uncharacterized protein n=1 Tax=Slackia exigua (strain ATCC 700122 / DSM 15923 / CIP 105133 / JCM 11022 / KCTC 5966 / S-7) TaxID=649764 RepID=D0WE73_SLAES|nr:hypothetical protein HMPREF0762_00098 [Slackia exigua ATCC 700122]